MRQGIKATQIWYENVTQMLRAVIKLYISQKADWTLNEIGKTSNRTLPIGRACFRGSEYILFEILALRAWNPPPRQPIRFGQHGQHRLSNLAGGFHALNARILKKIYSEPLKHEFQSCEGLVDGFCNFI